MCLPGLAQKVHELVEDARRSGARVLCGGELPSGPGQFYPPTVVADVAPHMRLFQEEVFGPIMAVCRCETDEEAVRDVCISMGLRARRFVCYWFAQHVAGGAGLHADFPQATTPLHLLSACVAKGVAASAMCVPICTVMQVRRRLQIELANNSAFGLGSYCFSRSQARAARIGRQIQSGMFVVNDYASNAMCQSLPFGGVKESGFDRCASGLDSLAGHPWCYSVCEKVWSNDLGFAAMLKKDGTDR